MRRPGTGPGRSDELQSSRHSRVPETTAMTPQFTTHGSRKTGLAVQQKRSRGRKRASSNRWARCDEGQSSQHSQTPRPGAGITAATLHSSRFSGHQRRDSQCSRTRTAGSSQRPGAGPDLATAELTTQSGPQRRDSPFTDEQQDPWRRGRTHRISGAEAGRRQPLGQK